MAYFTIDPGTEHVAVDATTRQGSVVFSAQNKTGAARRVRAIVVTDEEVQGGWYTIADPVRPARVDEAIQFTVDVAVPAGGAPGAYSFRLKVVAEDDPDDVYQESQQVTVEVPDAPPRKFPWWIVAVVVAAVVVVVGVLVSLLLRGGGTVAVPDVTGLERAAAEQALVDVELSVGDVSEEPSAEVPGGHVVTQDPAAGTEVDEGAAVDLVVSTGLVVVPDVTARSPEDAEAALGEAGLVLGDVTEEPSAEQPAGEVVSQDPVSGTEVEPGAAVALVVSSGPPEERIAHYPLSSDGEDATGTQAAMTLANTTFSGGGLFCNGVYASQPGGCNAITPSLQGFDFDAFSIAVEFQVADGADRPVIVGGNSFRWMGFLLNADQTVTLLSNNSNRQNCGGSYALGTWQQALLTYDGTDGRLYLNGELRCTVAFDLNHGNDPNVGVNNFSNATTFRGWIRELEAYDEVIVP